MKYSFSNLAVIVLSGIVSAQQPTSQIPKCAKTCIANAVAASTTCGPKDLWCQCQPNNYNAIVNTSTPCVIKKCNDPNGPTPIEVEADAQLKCFFVISAGPPRSSSSVSETASSTVSPGWTSSTTESTRETIIVGYAGLTPTSECDCEESEPAKAISSPTVANNSTYTTSSAAPKITSGASHLIVNAGSVFAVGMAVLAAL